MARKRKPLPLFADNVSKELPLEYAVEMNNLIHLEMKGSIG